MNKLEKAIQYANTNHMSQIRKGKYQIPYITHPIEVMKRVSKYTMDEDTLCATVLHDIIEDTAIEHETLEILFGKKVADIVEECTRPKDADKIEWLKGFCDKSLESTIIKMCDRLSNSYDFMEEGRLEKCGDYWEEAYPLRKIFLIIAPLGMCELLRTQMDAFDSEFNMHIDQQS